MKRCFTLVSLTILAVSGLVGTTTAAESTSERVKSRSFQLNYGGTLTGLPQNARVRVWLPVPQSSDHQEVDVLKQSVPGRMKVTVERKYGNKMVYFEEKSPPSGILRFETAYEVHRREVRGLTREAGARTISQEQRDIFLSANRRVPLFGKQLSLLASAELPDQPLEIARMLYNRVDDHVRYDKSQPGFGNGDVLWVCDSRFGNCTDFHSLFISLSRAKGVPARFEIGLPLPPKRGQGPIGGYHCWALFHTDDKGWVPVDISEADKHPDMKDYYFGNLTENRVTFTTGRDIQLVPRQEGQPLNFFVYPYVEVNGKPWPKDKILLSFSYADSDAKDES